MKAFKPAHLLSSGLLFYFLLPYVIFLTYYRFSFDFNLAELFWVIKNSLLQAGLTAMICVVLSLPMSQGLFALSEKWQSITLRLLIIPQILPALFSILIAFSLFDTFPMGSIGIIILFVFTNLGFATLLAYSAAREKLGALPVISEIYSLGRYGFFTQVYLRVLRRDLIANFLLIFIFCLSSFSIPLIVGGGRGTNIEVLVYEKIFVEQNWPAAFGLCMVQALFIFVISYFMLKNRKSDEKAEFSSGRYLESYFGVLLIFIYLLLYFGGYLVGLVKSLSYFGFIAEYWAELASVTWFTSKALVFYLLLNFLLLWLWLLDYLKNLKFNLAINMISVSTVLIGFALYLFFPLTKDFDILKIVFAMSVLYFPGLFKLFLQGPIENLHRQVLISKMYGLSSSTIIIEIILKQISQKLFLWLSMLTIWFISEYALFKALGVQTQTLGLFSEGFLSSYRLPASYIMSFYILVYWVAVMLILYFSLKVVYVAYKKFIA